MGLKEQVRSDLQGAIREKNVARRSALRALITALSDAELESKQPLSPDQEIDTVAREVRRRHDAIAEYSQAGRLDLVDVEMAELRFIENFLPTQLTSEELREIIRQTIAEIGASEPSQIGRVMKAVVPKIRGRGDARRANEIARALLAEV